MLYFNGQKSKIALVKYNRNDYEKVLEGLEETTITIPSSFTNINSNALKGLNNIELIYEGTVSGYPWGANEVEALTNVLDAIYNQNVTNEKLEEMLVELDDWDGSVYYKGSTALLTTVLNSIKNGE